MTPCVGLSPLLEMGEENGLNEHVHCMDYDKKQQHTFAEVVGSACLSPGLRTGGLFVCLFFFFFWAPATQLILLTYERHGEGPASKTACQNHLTQRVSRTIYGLVSPKLTPLVHTLSLLLFGWLLEPSLFGKQLFVPRTGTSYFVCTGGLSHPELATNNGWACLEWAVAICCHDLPGCHDWPRRSVSFREKGASQGDHFRGIPPFLPSLNQKHPKGDIISLYIV